MLTELTDGTGSTDNNDRRIRILALRAGVYGSVEACTVGVGVIESKVRGGEGKRDRSGFVVRNPRRDLSLVSSTPEWGGLSIR